jgi:LacI family transcriptional regulator
MLCPTNEDDAAWSARLEAFLDHVRRPAAIVAGNDELAVQVAEACTRRGWGVGDQVAIVGCDDDPLLCRSSHPALSSIQVPWSAIGAVAARTLQRLVHGKPIPEWQDLAPTGVSLRASTANRLPQDPLLEAVAHRLRQRASLHLGLDGLLAGLPASRSTLERRWRQVHGGTLLAQLRRERITLAQQALDRGLTVEDAARDSGFRTVARLREAFRLVCGVAPATWRRMRHQGGNRARPQA